VFDVLVRKVIGFVAGAAEALSETSATAFRGDLLGALWVHDYEGESSPTFKEFDSFGSPISLTASGYGYCRQLIFHTAGTVTLTPLTPVSGDTTETITVSDGQALNVKATAINSVSGVTAITVLW
jgi:hypothetical protein